MARKPENNFKINTVYPALDKLPNTYYFTIQQVAKHGDPDIILCINGRFVCLELKSDEESEIRLLQTYKLLQVTKARGLAFRADRSNWKEVYAELLKLAQGGHHGETIPSQSSGLDH